MGILLHKNTKVEEKMGQGVKYDSQKMREYFNNYTGKKEETEATFIFYSEKNEDWSIFYNKVDRTKIKCEPLDDCLEENFLYLNYHTDCDSKSFLDEIAPFDILEVMWDINNRLTRPNVEVTNDEI